MHFCRYFALERVSLHPKETPPARSPGTQPRVSLLIQVKKDQRGAAARGAPSGAALAPAATAPTLLPLRHQHALAQATSSRSRPRMGVDACIKCRPE
jgi:hypothetical protein